MACNVFGEWKNDKLFIYDSILCIVNYLTHCLNIWYLFNVIVGCFGNYTRK